MSVYMPTMNLIMFSLILYYLRIKKNQYLCNERETKIAGYPDLLVTREGLKFDLRYLAI